MIKGIGNLSKQKIFILCTEVSFGACMFMLTEEAVRENNVKIIVSGKEEWGQYSGQFK
jgi:hypothetical protein